MKNKMTEYLAALLPKNEKPLREPFTLNPRALSCLAGISSGIPTASFPALESNARFKVKTAFGASLMKSTLLPLLSALCISTFATAATTPQYAFSPNGIQPRKSEVTAVVADDNHVMPITVSLNASGEIHKAANEVAQVLERMTGHPFIVKESKEPQGIVIGTLEDFPMEDAASALAKKYGTLQQIDGFPVPTSKASGLGKWQTVEAFAIRTTADNVYLLGWTEKGAVQAASRFLELLGVRRFSPSQAWEIIPKATVVQFDAEEEQAPSYPFRDLWFAFGPNPSPKVDDDRFDDLQEWYFAVKLGGAFRMRSAHMYGAVYSQHKEEFDANKDKYYAEIKGSRERPGKFCLSQPRVREMIAETSLSQLTDKEGNRSQFSASAEPSDGGGWCECEPCKAMGTPSERIYIVANEVAKMAEAKYPGSNMIGVLAYFLHINPPSFKLEPNITVSLATRMYNGADRPIEDLIKDWPKHHANMGLYDYFSTYVWGQDRLRPPGAYVPAASPIQLAKDLKRYYDLGYRSMIAESMPNFALYGPGYWVASNVMWNKDASEEALINDFYEKAFGAASKPMQAFYELMSPESGRLMYVNTYAKLHALLDEASVAAAKDKAVLARIRELKLFMIFDYLQNRVFAIDKADKAEREEQTEIIRKFLYRSRFQWIGHYRAWFNSREARENAAAWINEGVITDEELAALWQEVKDFYKPVAIEEKQYSPDLKVVPNPDASDEDVAEEFVLSGGGGFVSLDGEPIQMNVTLGPKRLSKSYLLVENQNGEVVFQKDFEKKSEEEETIAIEIPLPAAGVYRFKWRGFGTAKVTVHKNLHFFVEKIQNILNTGVYMNRYFYIPSDIKTLDGYAFSQKNIVFFSENGERWEVEVPANGVFQVDIPEGYRGQTWYLNVGPKRGIHFFNVPNIFYLNPKNIIIPSDVEVH